MRERHNTCSISIKTEREREFYEKDGSNYAHFLKIDMGRKKELWWNNKLTYKSRSRVCMEDREIGRER